ncbi:MAG: hypothetical protein M0Z40_00860 [Actinomycetota bacterium]|jgi:hypothetical protein|nr:hypothetical protein [Actinomycetota bacterium]
MSLAPRLSDDEPEVVRRGPSHQPFGLETRYDAAFVAALALREKQIQQNYRPIIGIHKWFARRPGSVFRSLMLSEYVDEPLSESYWQSNDVAATVADPFMGGGTSIFEALRLGCGVVGCDINPMAYWLVRQGVQPLDLDGFRTAAEHIVRQTEDVVGRYYQTACSGCGEDVPVKYFFWVKTCACPSCGDDVTQNLLGRYDTYALKCQDIFSVHGYPVGLIVCEDSLLGIPGVGSGSFVHFVEKFALAKTYAKRPYETRISASKKSLVHMMSERIEAPLIHREPASGERTAWLVCEPSQTLDLAPKSLDGVFTDPPYFDNVQYAELMDFCFVWLRKLIGGDVPEFVRATTRTEHELTGNDTLGRGLENFTAGLSDVFSKMAASLKNGAPLVFTYHHNEPTAYAPLVVAILDAGLTCTGVLPAPAEMTASLHIAGTRSSILDSVFVCRDRTWTSRRHGLDHLWKRPIDERISDDVTRMAEAGYRCTDGDRQCLRAGHIASDAVRKLGKKWLSAAPLAGRITRVHECMAALTRGTA